VKHVLITSDPHVMLGKPVIVGTRITVEHILDERYFVLRSKGMSWC
jgi:uncharacterized protein (DUF433 family)